MNYSNFSLPSCSFTSEILSSSLKTTSNENDEEITAKAAAVNKELAFGCKIFQNAILHDQNQNSDFLIQSMLSLILPLDYEQAIIDKFLIVSFSFLFYYC